MNFKKSFEIMAFLMMLFPFSAQGQIVSEEWVKQYGSGYNNVATGITIDSKGNIYVTGESATIKYDTNGNELWIKSDRAYSIAVDSVGNVYGTGNDSIRKYDTNGNQLWAKSILEPWNQYNSVLWLKDFFNPGYASPYAFVGCYLYHLTLDSIRNVYATGFCRGINGADTGIMVKYDTNGNKLWATIDRLNNYPSSVVDTSGNVYLTGGNGTLKFDMDGNPLAGWSRTWLISGMYPLSASSIFAINQTGNIYIADSSTITKYDANYNEIWVTPYYGGTPAGILFDSTGNIYVTGTINGNPTTVEYDADGNGLWNKQYTSSDYPEYTTALTLDFRGNIYATGVSNGDYTTIKFDTNNGNKLWEIRYDGGGYDQPMALIVDSMSNVYVTGYGWNYNYTEIKYLTIKYSQAPNTPVEVVSVINEMVTNGDITNNGLANALTSLLNNAQTIITANPTAAKNMLEAAINKIEAQSGKQITTDAAEKLIGYLNIIISL